MSNHTHEFSRWPFGDPVNTISYCTAKVVRDGFPVLQVSHDRDGDWQFLDATTERPEDCVIVCLGCVFERDATLEQIADLPSGWSAWRSAIGGTWTREEDPPISEGGNE
jgi:hypothetical protein